MMQHLLVGFLILRIILSPAPTLADGDGYLIKKRDFRNRVNVIAFMPLDVAPDMQLRPEFAASIEQQITKKLQRKFTVISSAAFLGAANAFAQQSADALLSVEIVYVGADFDQDYEARWDGAEQDVQITENSLHNLTKHGVSGKIVATSLQIDIIDSNQAALYSRAGGIELIMERDGKRLEALPVEDLLQNEQRLSAAVKEALKSF